MFYRKVLFTALFIALLSACQKPAEEGDGSSAPPTPNNPRTGEATTDCGVVTNGKAQNPVKLQDGKAVTVKDVISNNLVSIEDAAGGGAQLLKLQGVSSESINASAAMQMIRNLTSNNPTFFKATNDCNVTLAGGGQGTIGQLITGDGRSVSESLIRSGLSGVDANDACNGNLIGACLNALNDSPPPTEEPLEEMRDFLWKPLSDTKGPIAVVLEFHCNTTIKVNGQALVNGGAGNGRCNTSSGTKSGCGYGSNIRVEVIDNNTGRPYTYKGQPYVIVPNGCNRFEFK